MDTDSLSTKPIPTRTVSSWTRMWLLVCYSSLLKCW